jgi:NAD(P)-dependent dehydrogenase (short-subunit alcohol dehydrogenase family)
VRRAVDADRLKAELGDQFTLLQFDLRDAQAIRTAADLVRSSLRGQGLRALVNNASIALGGPLAGQPMDEIRQQFEVNVLGTIAVTQAFIPLPRGPTHHSMEIPEGLSISAPSVDVSGSL